jgi:hypothetical protein
MPKPITGSTSAPSDEDKEKRSLVNELIKSENQVTVDSAKNLATACFSAIGVSLALKDKWLGTNPPLRQTVLLGFSLAVFLLASLFSLMAVNSFRHRVTPTDFEDVLEEIHRVAKARHRLTSASFVLFVVATAMVAWVALSH